MCQYQNKTERMWKINNSVKMSQWSALSEKDQSKLMDELVNTGKDHSNYSLKINFKVAGKLLFGWAFINPGISFFNSTWILFLCFPDPKRNLLEGHNRSPGNTGPFQRQPLINTPGNIPLTYLYQNVPITLTWDISKELMTWKFWPKSITTTK